MATPSSAAIIAASNDADLLQRLVALGSTLGLTQADVETARIRLASATVDSDGVSTVASVYEYSAAQPRYRAGEDPTTVTDAHLLHALGTITA
ncbi:TPA: hypothetical protein OQU49_004277 [Shigella flexneri]|nr:hypothetical protein [Shigella flexneri]